MNMRNYYNYCCGGNGGVPASDNGSEGGGADAGGRHSTLSHDSKEKEAVAGETEGSGLHVFDTLPLTFHVKTGLGDPEFARFEDYYRREEM